MKVAMVGDWLLFSRGYRFDSQRLHGGSRPPVILVPGDLMPCSLHTYGMQTLAGKAHIHI